MEDIQTNRSSASTLEIITKTGEEYQVYPTPLKNSNWPYSKDTNIESATALDLLIMK